MHYWPSWQEFAAALRPAGADAGNPEPGTEAPRSTLPDPDVHGK